MKKNPIDELFASKLKEHRLEPSQRALERFNERLDQKSNRKIAPWYYGAAASIALASFGLYFLNETKSSILVETINNIQKIETKSNDSKEVLDKSVLAIKRDYDTSPHTVIDNPNNTIVEESQEEKALIIDNNPSLITQQKEVKEELIIEDSKEVFADGSLKPSSLPQILNHQVEEDIILTYEVEKMPQERLRRFDEEPIGLAQAIQFEEYYFLHKNESESFEEPTILTKIGRQFQHLKKGEKVNFRELGLRPRDIFAKADKFIHEELGIENSIKTNKNIHSFGN